MNSYIPCNEKCAYQVDGLCELDTPTSVVNEEGGCAYKTFDEDIKIYKGGFENKKNNNNLI